MKTLLLKIGCGLLFLGTLARTSHGYEEDVHFILTVFLAKQAGISEQIAYELAKCNQATDDDPETEPYFGGGIFSFGFTARAMFHFADVFRLNQMLKDAEKCDPKQSGRYLHTAADHYSHAGYSSIFGHLTGGHRPDIPRNAPDIAAKMARELFIDLHSFATDNCPTWRFRNVDFDGHTLKHLKETRLIPFFTHLDDGITESKSISLTEGEWQKYETLWDSYVTWRKSTFGK